METTSRSSRHADGPRKNASSNKASRDSGVEAAIDTPTPLRSDDNDYAVTEGNRADGKRRRNKDGK